MFLKKFIPKSLLNYDKEYMFVGLGFLRLFIILMLLAGWIAAAASSTKKTEYNSSNTRPAKLAYLISVFLAILTSSIIFIISLFKVHEKEVPYLNRMSLFSLVSDLVFLVAVFASSIACAVAEPKIRSLNEDVNKGTFAIAAFFGFLSCIAYFIQISVVVYKSVMEKWKQLKTYLKDKANPAKNSPK
ncbi:hypothetical protein BpHYR1_046969 [Brachionus plicatilis]|uniref:MARVEL domain-containing protein n=1 Tax=Brachionus plicatilis TaxID=10195 RepID=A0A3M7SD80_BRAPC|nr:hypothetical protein BpHYR1_046969 [Brachionus plicatilis]